MATKIYAVEVSTPSDGPYISRYFQTIRAARRWAKWCASQSWQTEVRIMLGGAGGMEVK